MEIRAFPPTVLFIILAQSLVAQTSSTVTLFTSPDPFVDGALVAVTAAVRPPGATGRVTFYDGDTVIGSASITGGHAVLMTRLAGASAHRLRARYWGDTLHAPFDSAPVSPMESHELASVRETSRASVGNASSFLISTIAGGRMPPTAMTAASAVIGQSTAVATDAAGSVYVASLLLHAVFRLDPDGILIRVAGSGVQGNAGDGSPAVSAALGLPSGLVLDSAGNLYIADRVYSQVRRVGADGVITTVVGNGCCGYGGDGGPATEAALSAPSGVALDSTGNLYVVDTNHGTVRKVDSSGRITTVAGTGFNGYSGDGVSATNSQLNYPTGVAVNAAGELFIADSQNARVRKVNTAGIISTVAGTGVDGCAAVDGPATATQLTNPYSVTFDSLGNLYIGDGCSLRKVAPNGITVAMAGNGSFGGYGGDGIATATPAAVVSAALDQFGDIYVVSGGKLQEIKNGSIKTITPPSVADGSVAALSMLGPQVIARDNSGNLYFIEGNQVRKIDSSGAIVTVAGTGAGGYDGDNGPATAAQLSTPYALAVDSTGNLYIADSASRIRIVSPGGTIASCAGSVARGYSGDGGQATAALLSLPLGMAIDAAGNLYIADNQNQRIRKVSANGIISTVAGIGTPGFSGDNDLAVHAAINSPSAVAVDQNGNVYVVDTGNQRVRKIATNGVITTIAGGGTADGDGGPATSAQLGAPIGVAVDRSGNVYIAESQTNRFRMVAANGIITTIAGTGAFGSYGDGGPAVNAAFEYPAAIVFDNSGNLTITDDLSHTVRLLTPIGQGAVLSVSSTHTGNFLFAGTGQYHVTVSNAYQAGSTSGKVTVSESVPTAFPDYSLSGDGWTCGSTMCSRSDPLSGGSSYPDVVVTVSVPQSAPSQVTNQVTVSGGGAAMTGGSDLTLITVPPPVAIQTNPPGLQFSVDGLTVQTAPQSVSLNPGSHTIAVANTQPDTPGKQYVFTGWSDFGAASHAIDVTGVAATYTASFKTQYRLTTSAFPETGGTLSPATGIFYDAGSLVNVTYTPTAPYAFNSWTGAASGAADSVSITLNSPQSIVANFAVPGFTCAVTGDNSTSVADVQAIVNEALGVAAPNHDLNRDNAITVADVQKVIQAATGTGCLY